jgi:ATP-binding cassette subfamily B protein
MVQQPSVFSKQYITQQLTQTLGQALSAAELSKCLEKLQFLEPTIGKQFWQASDATAGIYIILAGKVRLLDRDDNLIASREAPDSLILLANRGLDPTPVRLKLSQAGIELLTKTKVRLGQ